MNICKTCISQLHPDYFTTHNPDTIPWSRATCHHCGVQSEEIMTTTKELLDKMGSEPTESSSPKKIVRKAKKPATEPAVTKPAVTKHETYKYLLIEHNSPDPPRLWATKKELLADIEDTAIKHNNKDIDIYKLTPLEHKAEIKIEIGE